MGLEDLTGKVTSFLKDGRVAEALKSEQAENISDKVLDAAAGAVNDATGQKFEAQIDSAREAADKQVGTE